MFALTSPETMTSTPSSEDHATQGNIRKDPVNPEMNVQKNGNSGSYEAVVDGQVVGIIVYHTPHGNQRVTLSHTLVEPEYRGRGIATRLVKHALDDLRAQDLKLTNYCPFVADYIADHPEYKELVDSRFPGRATVPDRAPRERAN
ncbi:GNAT family N-acetyltransferase [Streptomyces sp. NPDC046994]|uniref:GNAT family N-acetyltransferase n=1 Tax=Streptomyces sp. NPDC046994 TaxID=3155735 RepID=UPI003455E61F